MGSVVAGAAYTAAVQQQQQKAAAQAAAQHAASAAAEAGEDGMDESGDGDDNESSSLYNIGATRDNVTYWVALWWQEPVHFRLAELSSAGSASHRGAEPSFRCFWNDAELPADLRRHYQQCNRLAN